MGRMTREHWKTIKDAKSWNGQANPAVIIIVYANYGCFARLNHCNFDLLIDQALYDQQGQQKIVFILVAWN